MSDARTSPRRVSWSAVWRESKQLLWARRRRLLAGLALLAVSRLAGLVLPATSKLVIDEVITQRRVELLPWIVAATGIATLVQAAASFGLTVLLGVAGQRAINDLRLRVQRHVGRLPIRFFEEHKSGELVSRIMNDAEGVRNLVGTGFVQLAGGLITSGAALAVLLWLNWRLTLLTLVLLAVFAVVMAIGLGRLRPIFRKRSQLMAEAIGRLSESLQGAKVVKAYTAEKREERIFAGKAHRLLRNIARGMVGVSTITSLSALIFGLTGIALSVVGAREALAGRMTVGDLFMFVIFTGMLVTPLIQMSNIATQITEAFAGLDRIREILSEPTEDDRHGGRESVGRLRGEVVFEDVTFEYEEGRPVLEEVSFETPAGTTTALVGPSGAGKSTVISLVMGFRRPRLGRILVDGRDLAELGLREYRAQLAVVLQEDFLFDGTIGENIAYSRRRASREEIARAGQLARCDEFVDGFDKGYDTVIGERGVRLSGGQRQRVTIARAILADPRILILDEATSSLDSENEALIQEGFGELKRGRTTLVIAHRLSTIRNADQILVMEGGRIVERGSHRELMRRDGPYRRLYERQYRLERDRFINPGEDFSVVPSTPIGEVPAGPGGGAPFSGRSGLPKD